MSRSVEVSPEQRETDLAAAQAALDDAAEAWCEAHITRQGRREADERVDAAEGDYKRAARRHEDTRLRLQRPEVSATVLRHDGTHCGAEFSKDRTYRYSLTRSWVGGGFPLAAFVGLNPSTADELADDPTVRRCMGFARSWGMGGMVMLNAFAFRATDPKVMKAHASPVGEYNDHQIVQWVHNAHVVVPCWGVHGEHMNRGDHVRRLLEDYAAPKVRVLGLTKHGHPKHPLYLAKSSRLEVWQ